MRGSDRAVRLIGAIVPCLLLVACRAYRLPALPEEYPELAYRPILGVAKVRPAKHGSHISPKAVTEFMCRLQEDLSGTGLFEGLVLDDAPAAVDIQPEYEARYCFSEPLVAVVTIGIIPQPSCYHSGYRLVVSGSALPNGGVVVDNRSRPTRLWGWVAGPLALSPEWSASLPREHEVRALRSAILVAVGMPQGAPTER